MSVEYGNIYLSGPFEVYLDRFPIEIMWVAYFYGQENRLARIEYWRPWRIYNIKYEKMLRRL